MKPGKIREYLRATNESGGYYVTDCWPWQIKEGCKRMDCPMRTLLLPPEAKETDFLIDCTPVGELADFLLSVKAISK